MRKYALFLLILLTAAALASCGGGPILSAPAIPTALAATARTSSSLSLSWAGSTGAESYELRRATSQSQAASSQVYLGAAFAYTDTGLAPATTYYYWVRALNSVAASEYTAALAAATLPAAPSTPTGLERTAGTASTLEISWDAVALAESYELFIDTLSTGSFATRAYAGAATSCLVTGLEIDRAYYFKVRAKNEGGSSAFSSSLTARTTDGIPPGPAGFAVTGASSSSLTLAWNQAAEAEEYILTRSDSEGGSFSEVYRGTSLALVDDGDGAGLANGRVYYYKLQARSRYGDGPVVGPVSWTTGDLAAWVTID